MSTRWRRLATTIGTAMVTAAVVATTTLVAIAAHADDRPALVEGGAAPDRSRAWLYADDAILPRKYEVLALSRVTFTGATDGAIRPFASGLGRPGGVYEQGAEVGLGAGVSLTATGSADGLAGLDARASGAMAAFRYTPFGDGPTRLVATFGAMRELGGHAGVFSRASFAGDVGRVRFGGTVHAERVFAPTRDALDVMVTAAVSYALPSLLRVGVEYVAQDLEGALDPLEKEGVRHFVGPTLGVALDSRLSLTAGPAVGLSPGSPQTVGRLALVCAF